MRFAIRCVPACWLSSNSLERGSFSLFASILLPLVHLLLELLCFLLVYEGEASKTLFELERVEEGPVLVVKEGIVYLLIPDDTTI